MCLKCPLYNKNARCVTEAFSTTCAVHIEDCEGWWLSSCRGSVAEHWRLKPEVSWVRLLVIAGFFTFLYFRLITSKFIYSATTMVEYYNSVVKVSIIKTREVFMVQRFLGYRSRPR